MSEKKQFCIQASSRKGVQRQNLMIIARGIFEMWTSCYFSVLRIQLSFLWFSHKPKEIRLFISLSQYVKLGCSTVFSFSDMVSRNFQTHTWERPIPKTLFYSHLILCESSKISPSNFFNECNNIFTLDNW